MPKSAAAHRFVMMPTTIRVNVDTLNIFDMTFLPQKPVKSLINSTVSYIERHLTAAQVYLSKARKRRVMGGFEPAFVCMGCSCFRLAVRVIPIGDQKTKKPSCLDDVNEVTLGGPAVQQSADPWLSVSRSLGIWHCLADSDVGFPAYYRVCLGQDRKKRTVCSASLPLVRSCGLRKRPGD
jgi:hypothetical protein